MSTKATDPFAENYESDLEENFDKSEAYSPEVEAEKIQQLVAAAKDYRKKKGQRITVRVYNSDLDRIKYLAEEEGLSYQTYITSILHKLSIGRLKEVRV
jgi:predicted DNA binding CopG/RHH family protein